MNSIYVLSKPIQFLNALSVIYKNRDAARVWMVRFPNKNFDELAGLIDDLDIERRIIEFIQVESIAEVGNRIAVLDKVRLHIEDDRVSNYEFYSKYKLESLSVIEEGIGTYCKKTFRASHRSILRARLQLFKWSVRGFFTGAPISIGFGPLTSKVYVTQPSLFFHLKPELRHKIIKIDSPLSHKISICDKIDSQDFIGKEVVLIAGGWLTTEENVSQIKVKFDGVLFFKLHPHCSLERVVPGVISIDSCIPVEFFIKYFSSVAKNVTVIHWSSTIEFYLGYISNVKVIDFKDVC